MKRKIEWILPLSCAVIFVIAVFIGINIVDNSSNTTTEIGQAICGYTVEGWVEQTGDDYFQIFYSVRHNNQTLLSITSDTASCLNIVNQDNKFERSLDTGENYLYINPNNNHFDIISASDIEQLQDAGELCLTADQAWKNIGLKRTCVGFRPTRFTQSNGFIFFNEKHDYINGFTATITRDHIVNWDSALDQYGGKEIIVSGAIEEYQNHPEIKIYDISQISSPAKPYAYSSKYGFVYKSVNSKL